MGAGNVGKTLCRTNDHETRMPDYLRGLDWLRA